jgi:release factor glutamine methyltransferase
MQKAIEHIRNELNEIFTEQELRNITVWLLTKISGYSATGIIINKNTIFSENQSLLLNKYIAKLKRHEPLQYVLGETEFMGLTFSVDHNVLIPRPETEELVEWICSQYHLAGSISMVDIGTGSGCIAISLKKMLSNAAITALDISPQALLVAQANAQKNGVRVDFYQQDILAASSFPENKWDVIVSNPPYIPMSEMSNMDISVLEYEPHEALFVSDTDALIFYRAIALYARSSLKEGGELYFEIHYDKGNEVVDLLKQTGFEEVELRKDMSGHDRMIRARYSFDPKELLSRD